MADSLPLKPLNAAHLPRPVEAAPAIALVHRLPIHKRAARVLRARVPSHAGRPRIQRRRHPHRISRQRGPVRRVVRVRPRRLFEELFRRRAQGAVSDAELHAHRRGRLAVDLMCSSRRLLGLELLSSPLLPYQRRWRSEGGKEAKR